MFKTTLQMDTRLVTASMYAIGGLANLVVLLNTTKRWRDNNRRRESSGSIAMSHDRISSTTSSITFSISLIFLMVSCGKAAHDIYQSGLSRYESKVFVFWYTVHLHLLSNMVLIMTAQTVLRVVVSPHWVRVRMTRRTTDKCVNMQWSLMTVTYSPVLIVQFLMKREDLDELLTVLADVATLVIFTEAGLIILLTILVLACTLIHARKDGRGRGTQANDSMTMMLTSFFGSRQTNGNATTVDNATSDAPGERTTYSNGNDLNIAEGSGDTGPVHDGAANNVDITSTSYNTNTSSYETPNNGSHVNISTSSVDTASNDNNISNTSSYETPNNGSHVNISTSSSNINTSCYGNASHVNNSSGSDDGNASFNAASNDVDHVNDSSTTSYNITSNDSVSVSVNPCGILDETSRIHRYWLVIVVFYFAVLPDTVYTFVTFHSSPTLSVVKSMSSLGTAIGYLVFFMLLR